MARGWTISMALMAALVAVDAAAESYEPSQDEPVEDEPAVVAEEDEDDRRLELDNHGAGLLSLAARATSTAVSGGPDERGDFGLGAVSYTHLTLPTIYSV